MDYHQTLMNEADKKHQKGISYENFLLKLDCLERRATVLGNLNYQVENGGFEQWRFNGYMQPAIFIRDAVGVIQTDAGRAVARIVAEALAASENQESIAHCDEPYYEIHEQFMKDCEEYFAKEYESCQRK